MSCLASCQKKTLSILEILKISGKSRNYIQLKPGGQSSRQDKNFVNTGKKLLKHRN